MKPTYHHYSALAISITIFVVSIVGYAFIYYSVGNQASKTTEAEVAVQNAEKMATEERNVAGSLQSTAEDRELISSFILSSDATVPFIVSIEGLSSKTGAKVSLVSISADANYFHAHVNIQDSWRNTMRAMHLVENMPYSLSVDNVRLVLQGKGVWDEEFDITIPISKT